MKKFYVLWFWAALTFTAKGQSNLFEAGLLFGGSTMTGDLVESNFGSINGLNLAYGFMLRRYFSTNIAVRASVIHSKLNSEDRHYDRFGGQVFLSETPLTEISLDFQYDILGHQRNWRGSGGKISPYIYLGVGMAMTDPKLTYDFESEDVLLDENADYSKMRVVMPFGAGIRWGFSPKGTIVLELGARPTFSDYLDGVSLAGNPGKNDWYGLGGVQFWYKIAGDKY